VYFLGRRSNVLLKPAEVIWLFVNESVPAVGGYPENSRVMIPPAEHRFVDVHHA
jgi:hypothetical protein